MPELESVVFLVVGVVIVNGIAGRIRVPAPILLVVAGIAVSFIPGVPDFEVDPEIILTVLLPPLLYAAAGGIVGHRDPADAAGDHPARGRHGGGHRVRRCGGAARRSSRTIPFAAALALGAIVAPPDAVAAVAVARRAGLPRSVVTVLEGESLFNDATSLVLLRVAIVGIGAGSMAWGPAIGEFAWAAAGGVLIGVVLGLVLSYARRSVGSTLAITALSLVTPWLAYLVGESAHASGRADRRGHRAGPGLPVAVRSATGGSAHRRRDLERAAVRAGGLGLRADRSAAVGDRHRAGHRPGPDPADRRGSAGDRHRDPAGVDLPADRARAARRPARDVPLVATAGRGVLGGDARGGLAGGCPDPAGGHPLSRAAVDLHDRRHPGHPGAAGPHAAGGDQDAEDAGRSGRGHRRERAAARDEANRAIAASVEEVIADERAARRARPAGCGPGRPTGTGEGSPSGWTSSGDDAQERLDRISDWRHELVSIERDVFVSMRNSGAHLRGRAARTAVRPGPGGVTAGPPDGGRQRSSVAIDRDPRRLGRPGGLRHATGMVPASDPPDRGSGDTGK